MDDIYPDNLREDDGEGEKFENELSTEETPVASNPFDDLTAIATASAVQSNTPNPFDPFAPQDTPVDAGNLLDTFQDETPNNNLTNQSEEVDLLTPENNKQAINGSAWWQLDAINSPEGSNKPPVEEESINGFEQEVLMGTPANLSEETTETFANESKEEENTGFFSLMRGLVSTPEQGSGVEPVPNTTAENLEVGGNSLPHPDSLKHGASGDYLEEDNHSENSTVDEENGTSKALRTEIAKPEEEEELEDVHLDENGLSLPHPETVLPEVENNEENDSVSDNAHLLAALDAASAQSDSDIEVTSDSEDEESDYTDRESTSESSVSGTYLDRHGNSLPHPDEHMVSPSGHGAPTMKWGNIKMSIQSLISKTSKRGESTKDIDIETGDGDESDSQSDSASSSDSDSDFDDENNAFTKNNLRNLIEEHKDNPTSRLIFSSVLAFFLLLIIVIPASTRKKIKPLDTNSQVVATLPPTVIVDIEDTCVDEIVLTDRNGNDLVNGTSTSDDIACFTMDEPIHFRFKRCRPASPLDWVGVFPARSMFMERLWKDHYDGVYLCGDQPCPTNDPLNQKGGPPRSQTLKAPPIKTAGEYRLFLVKDSSWPHEYVDFTPSFSVVDQKSACLGTDNIFEASKPNFTPINDAESIYIQTPTVVPTGFATGVVTGTGTNFMGFRA